MGIPNLFRYLRKEAPAWFFALSAAARRGGPLCCQAQLDAQPVVVSLRRIFAAACRILHLQEKESVCNTTYTI
jgi:hypothetical protein